MKVLIKSLVFILIGLASVIQAEQSIIESSAPASSDCLATEIDVSGDYMIASALFADSIKGYAVIFKKENGTWIEQVKLQPSDLSTNDYFGISLSIDGDVAIVGAHNQNSSVGAAYIFRRNGETWEQKAKLVGGTYFGVSVKIQGNLAFIGSGYSGIASLAGAVHIYENSGNDTWQQIAQINNPENATDAANDWFGHHTALNNAGDILVIGAPYASNGSTNTGAVYVYSKVSSSNWTYTQKLTSPSEVTSDFYFPYIYGDRIVVGCFVVNSNRGAIYIYEKNSGTGLWELDETITASDVAENDYFAKSVSIYEDTIEVGASSHSNGKGAVYLYKKIDGDWVENKIPFSPQAGSNLGISTKLTETAIYAGAYAYDHSTSITNSGAVYIKTFTTNTVFFGFNDEIAPPFDGSVKNTGSISAGEFNISSYSNISTETVESFNQALVFSTTTETGAKISGLNISDWGKKFVLEAKIWKGNETTGQINLVQTADGTTIKWYISNDGKMHLDLSDGTNSASVVSNASVLTDATWTEVGATVDLMQATAANAFKFYTNTTSSKDTVAVTITETNFGSINLAPSNTALELINRDAAFTLKTDFIQINFDMDIILEGDFYENPPLYVAPGSSSAIQVTPESLIRRVTNPPSDFASGQLNPGATASYDTHPGTPSVFHGIFEINLMLDSASFDGTVTVDIYIQKPGDSFKKIGEVSTSKPSSGDWNIKYYWNSRVAAYQWTSTDAQAYRTDGPIRFKFQVR